ncbi:MAG TPA: DNA polymerase Y family protein, partial [Lacipirellulaceae bacterium]|nr:DNA polymerase Y family protein [Lacipirellulaceae bacterium]
SRDLRACHAIVTVCCGKAAERGVRPAMPLAEAQTLVRGLGVAAYEPAADRRALAKLAEVCERFSPRVAVEEADEPESLLLDISNLEHLYGSEAKLVRRVEKFFTRRGYRVRLAIAETVGAAWAAAHCEGRREKGEGGGRNNEGTRNSSFVIRHSSFPIEALRIAEETAALLSQLGIETVDQLLTLPREELASRFGEELLRRLDQLTGRGRELIEPQRGLPPLVASYSLEEPTTNRGVLVHVLKQLTDQLALQLAARGQGAVVLVCWLHLAGWHAPRLCEGRGGGVHPTPFGNPQGMPPQILRIGLLQPSASARQLLELIELHLENVQLAGEVDRVELRAVVVGRLGERQRELFGERWPTDSHQLSILVNRLSSRLGDSCVLRAELRKSPVPERAVEWRPAVGRKERESGRRGPPLPPRPLLLYPAPKAVEVVCVAPDGPPQFAWMGKHRERILGCVGPERIETLWWRGPSVRRDYYRVATESDTHLWMFRRLTDGRWFTHGEFV